jgi:transposase
MLYTGIDLHKRHSVLTTMNAEGEILNQAKVLNQPDKITSYFNNLDQSFKRESHQALIEATFAWGWQADLLESHKIQVMLAHPQKTKAIASARIKTDKVDSTVLADLLRTNFVAPAHYTDAVSRDKQELLRSRARLVYTRSSLKNKLHSILHKHNLNPEWDNLVITDLFGKAGRRWLAGKRSLLPPHTQFVFDQLLVSIDQLKDQISLFDQEIKATWELDENAKLLSELPGIGVFGGLLLSAEIGPINRFSNPDKLCSFAGLTPSLYQSGEKTRMGRIKPGNKYVRWILIQAAPKAIKKDRKLAAFYLRIARRKGNKKAKVATARKMLSQIHVILTRQQYFIQEPGIPAFFSDSGRD